MVQNVNSLAPVLADCFFNFAVICGSQIPLHLTSEGNNIVFALKLPSYYEEENVVKGNNTNTTVSQANQRALIHIDDSK